MIKEIKVKELELRLSEKTIKLIDVREKHEIEICSIKDSINIEMRNIPQSEKKLNPNDHYAIICHSGVRSLYVCEYLQNRGFKVFNTSGGIDEWAKQINPKMDRY